MCHSYFHFVFTSWFSLHASAALVEEFYFCKEHYI